MSPTIEFGNFSQLASPQVVMMMVNNQLECEAMNKVLTDRFYCNPTDEDFDATKGLGVNFSSDSDNLFTLTLMIF